MATIEERLDAMAVTLEATIQTQHNTERIINLLAEAQVKSEDLLDKAAGRLDKAEEMLNKLVFLARKHDARIERLEEGK